MLNRELVGLLDNLMSKLDSAGQQTLRDLIAQTGDDPEALLALLKELAALDFKWKPVDMETFIDGKDYLNLKGQVYPQLKKDLIELFDGGYHEALLFGAIGWGKSTVGEIALARMLYEVSCLADPQRAFGLMDGSTIAFINASVNLKQAEKVVFGGMKAKLLRSPYFREQFPFEADLKKEMRFPGNILVMPVAGSEGGTIGYNVLGGLMDEVNFWQIVEKSSQNKGQKFDQARHVYDMLIRRMKSRFNQAGKLPGILMQISSSKYPDDFTEERLKEIQQSKDTRTFVRRYSTWTTKPRTQFLPESFYLYRGTSADKPAISKRREDFEDKDQELVVEVPMDFWRDFETDISGSIRDLAGYPTLAIEPFFSQKDKLMEAVEKGRLRGMRHPYTVDVTTLEDGATVLRQFLKFNPTLWYYAHIDLAIKKDRAGLAISHVAGWTEVQRVNKDGVMVTDTVPIIVVDFMLRIQAPPGGEIQVDYVRALLLEMRSYGANFKKITYDQYQSASSIQAFQRMGIDSDKLSVDTSLDAYNALKEAILENRIVLYDYEPFIEELVRLETKTTGRGTKVDHPPKGSKDVTDAVAGAVYHASIASLTAQIDPSFGETTAPPANSSYHLWTDRHGVPLEPVVDDKGRLLPGKAPRSIDDVLFSGAEEAAKEEEEDDYGYGFA